MKLIPLEQEDDSQYADHGLTIAPTASSLSLGIGSFHHLPFDGNFYLVYLLHSLISIFPTVRSSLVELLVRLSGEAIFSVEKSANGMYVFDFLSLVPLLTCGFALSATSHRNYKREGYRVLSGNEVFRLGSCN